MKINYAVLVGLVACIFILLCLLVLPLINAQLIFKQNNLIDLKIPCFNNGTICSDSATCNITIVYPNSSMLIDNQRMTNLENGYHNYTLNESKTATLGEYSCSVFCKDGSYNGYSTFIFFINPTGQEITAGQGFVSIGLIMAMIFLAGFFAFFGFKLAESDRLFPIALFFMLISLILGVYVIHLGYVYSRDILFPLATEGVQFKIYIGIMYGLVGMALIGLLLLIVKTLKEFRIRKSLQQHGEGWDIHKNIYDH